MEPAAPISSASQIDFAELRRRIERAASIAATLYEDRFSPSTPSRNTITERPCLSVRDLLPKKRAGVDATPLRKPLIVDQSPVAIDYPTLVIFNTALRVSRIQNFIEVHGKALSLSSSFLEAKELEPSEITTCTIPPQGEVVEKVMGIEKETIPLSSSCGLTTCLKSAAVDSKENIPIQNISLQREQVPRNSLGRARVVRPEGATVRDGIDIDSSEVVAWYVIRVRLFAPLTISMITVSCTERRSALTASSCSPLLLTTQRSSPCNGYTSASNEISGTWRAGLHSPEGSLRTAIQFLKSHRLSRNRALQNCQVCRRRGQPRGGWFPAHYATFRSPISTPSS